MTPVKITIHSETVGAGDADPATLVAFGQLTEKDGTVYVRYDESEVTGMEGTRTTLKWTEDTLTVIRHGRYEHRQQYERGRNSSFQYRTPYFTVPMTVFTRELAISRRDRAWQLRVFFDLEMDSQPNGSIRLQIEIEEEEQLYSIMEGVDEDVNAAAELENEPFDFWTEVDKSLKRQGVLKDAK